MGIIKLLCTLSFCGTAVGLYAAPIPWRVGAAASLGGEGVIVAVFIDGAYLDKLLKNEFPGTRVDLDKLARLLAGSDQILRTYYYDSPPHVGDPPTPEERQRQSSRDSYFAALGRLPRFTVRLGRCVKRHDDDGTARYEQKGVDVWMATDIVLLASKGKIDKAILVTGDSDLIPAVEIARDEGVMVHLYHGATPGPLWDECDDRTRMSGDIIDQVRR